MNDPIIKPRYSRQYQICKCCVMDTSDEDIIFDSNGICMRCNEYKERIEPDWNHGNDHETELNSLLSKVKEAGRGKKYDCILGLSGGLDSSYMLHLAVTEWGLRPYVYHIDAGWDLPVAVDNIRKMTDKLGVELHIETLDWKEMKEMQLAWFRTGLESLDVPQDHAFISVIDKLACSLGIKYILNGYNIATEAYANPASWGKGGGPTGDGTFLKDVIKKYCSIPIKNYKFTSGFKHKFVVPFVYGVKTLTPLNYVPFTKQEMLDVLGDKYGYVPYGQKHFEDLITKFLEGYWIPTRFGHDIRRAWLSALVITGQMSRDEALKILEQPPMEKKECAALFTEVARRLEITEEELNSFINLPECTEKFKNQGNIYRLGIRIYEFIGLEKRVRR